ncbi:hypothetical protein DVH24_027546 [Malus domestica]|uniref:Uncharacterized protein n=1 Tax=Malus domestica TaxID=3750 RepID=A0A498H8T3_MALDO|nr:hypothetical protein DVH24_027546 [Malus domestica]
MDLTIPTSPNLNLNLLLSHRPLIVSLESDKLKENVRKVMSMGVASSYTSFMIALYVITRMNGQKGWICVGSEARLKMFSYWHLERIIGLWSKMDQMGWQPSDVAGSPFALIYSLDKHIIPRSNLLSILQGKTSLVELDLGFEQNKTLPELQVQ